MLKRAEVATWEEALWARAALVLGKIKGRGQIHRRVRGRFLEAARFLLLLFFCVLTLLTVTVS